MARFPQSGVFILFSLFIAYFVIYYFYFLAPIHYESVKTLIQTKQVTTSTKNHSNASDVSLNQTKQVTTTKNHSNASDVSLNQTKQVTRKNHSNSLNTSDTFSTSTSSGPPTSLLAQLKTIEWESFAVAPRTLENIQTFADLLIQKLMPFLVKSPLVPVNTSCFPPPVKIPAPDNSNNCVTLKEPRRIGVLLQFGFDVDALEIHLQELDAVVDKFFIIEAIRSHSNYLKVKPLLWDYVKFEERFASFLPKVIHFIVDDADLSGTKNDGRMWVREKLQEQLRWRKFLQWNAANNFFRSTDLLGFGDTDEIPNRDNIFYLKHCKVHEDPIDIGIWFPYQGSQTIFRPDYHVKGHPYTLGDPTYWSLGKALKAFNNTRLYPSRMRGKSPGQLLGGLHLSLYHYLPLQFAKLLTASEAEPKWISIAIEAGKCYTNEKYAEVAAIVNTKLNFMAKNTISVQSFRSTSPAEADAIIKLPWFYNCNRERYPSFEMKHDSRLGKM